jgi:SAM-dependent methyltransferase
MKTKVTCVDVSRTAVEACTSRGLDAYQVQIGHEPLPFPSATFDLVWMTEVLEHLSRPDSAMAEVRRVLNPRGDLILSTPNLACFPNRFLLAAGVQPLFSEVSEELVLGRRLPALGQGSQPVGHLRLYTKRSLREFLELVGFENLRVKGVPFHQKGVWNRLEGVAGVFPSLAMILVVLAKRQDGIAGRANA